MESTSISPYLYEPMHRVDENSEVEIGSSSSSEEEERIDASVRIDTTAGRSQSLVSEWCKCGCCSNTHLSDIECICCHEWSYLDERIATKELKCVTHHPHLSKLCLDWVYLTSMWPYIMEFKKIRGPIPEFLNNRCV